MTLKYIVVQDGFLTRTRSSSPRISPIPTQPQHASKSSRFISLPENLNNEAGYCVYGKSITLDNRLIYKMLRNEYRPG